MILAIQLREKYYYLNLKKMSICFQVDTNQLMEAKIFTCMKRIMSLKAI